MRIQKIRSIKKKIKKLRLTWLQREFALDLIRVCRKYNTGLVAESDVLHGGHLRFNTINTEFAHIITRDFKNPGIHVFLKTQKRIRRKK